MPKTFVGQLSYLTFLSICALPLLRGRPPERATGAFLALVSIATPLIQDHVHYDDPRGLLTLINLPPLIWLVGLALLIGRPWMLAAAAFELLCTTTEVAHEAVRRLVGAWVYLSTFIAFSWGVYLSLLAGVLFGGRKTSPPESSLGEA
jgi:hypothetical protein